MNVFEYFLLFLDQLDFLSIRREVARMINRVIPRSDDLFSSCPEDEDWLLD